MRSKLAGCFGEPGFVARRTAAGANHHCVAPLLTARRKPAPAFAGGRFQVSSRSLLVALRRYTAVFPHIAVVVRAPQQVRACAS
ncbi:hypothetical protein QF002_007278 [Paraburkholderia youngii]